MGRSLSVVAGWINLLFIAMILLHMQVLSLYTGVPHTHKNNYNIYM